MTSRPVMTVAVLVALGQRAAVAALLPSLGLLIQQIVAALGGSG